MAECTLERLGSDIHREIFHYIWTSISREHRRGRYGVYCPLAVLTVPFEEYLTLSKRLYPSLKTSFYDWTPFELRPLKSETSSLGKHLLSEAPFCKDVKVVHIRSWKTFPAEDVEYTLSVLRHIAPVHLIIHTNEFRPTIWDALQFQRLRHLKISCDALSMNSTAGRWTQVILRAAETLETLTIEEIGDRSKKGFRLLASSGVTFPKLRRFGLYTDGDSGLEFSNDLIPFVTCLLSKCTPRLTQIDLDSNVSPKLVRAILSLQGKYLRGLEGLRPAQLRDFDEDEDDEGDGYDSQNAISEDSQGEGEGEGSLRYATLYGDDTLAKLAPKLEYLYLQRATETRYADLPPSLRSLRLLLPDEEAKNILAGCLTEEPAILRNLWRVEVETDSEGMEVVRPTVLRQACDSRNIECIERFL